MQRPQAAHLRAHAAIAPRQSRLEVRGSRQAPDSPSRQSTVVSVIAQKPARHAGTAALPLVAIRAITEAITKETTDGGVDVGENVGESMGEAEAEAEAEAVRDESVGGAAGRLSAGDEAA